MATTSIPSDWTPVGSTSNTDYFTPRPDVLIVWPHAGLKDGGASARENAAFQMDYARRLQRPITVVVLLGQLLGQDPEARRVYAEELDATFVRAAALVVDNRMARAIGSFFLGLRKPRFPTKMFDSLDAAVRWAMAS